MESGRRFWIVLWICAGILTGVTLISCVGDSVFGSSGAPSATPVSHPSDYLSRAPFAGSLVLTTAGRELFYAQSDSPCPTAMHIIEMATTVRLLAYADPDGASCLPTGSIGSLALSTPLGRRRVIDDLTGRTIAVMDESDAQRLAHIPPYLFSASGSPLGDIAAAAPGFAGGATFGQAFSAGAGAPAPAGAQLWIVASTGTWQPTGATTPITVRGQAGLAAPGAIEWHEHGMTYALVWQLPPSNSLVPPPSTASLLLLAATLVPVSG